MTALVELKEVSKLYGGHAAVDALSLTVCAGERLALLGHNGAGKTTLMKLMLGIVPASTGHLSVLGSPPGDIASPERRSIGFLPESIAFHHALTGMETLRFYARLKRRGAEECATLLDRVGLSAAAGRRVSTYSKGMRQRLGLAQALLGQPRLMLLDEPTSGLDPDLRQVFYELVGERAAGGAAVVLSSHLLTELEERTDRIAIMDRGRLVALGSLDELRLRAGLPLTLTLTPARAAGPLRDWPACQEGDAVVVSVPAGDKLKALRAALSLTGITDIGVTEPGLSALYAHFTAREKPA